MRKTRVLAVAVGLVTLCLSVTAFADSENRDARAYLSWSSTDTLVTDLTTPGPANNLFLIFRQDNGDGSGLDFKGAEIDLTWSANETMGPACFEHTGTTFKTSSGTTCTYLNRGSAVPVTTADDFGVFHVAWANTTPLTGCTQGVGLVMAFEFDGCVGATPRGTITMNLAQLLDSNNIIVSSADGTMSIGNASVYINQDTPVQPTTWGAIKSQYGR